MEMGLGPGDIMSDGDPAPPHGKGHSNPHFSANVYCGETVAHLSNCWALSSVYNSRNLRHITLIFHCRYFSLAVQLVWVLRQLTINFFYFTTVYSDQYNAIVSQQQSIWHGIQRSSPYVNWTATSLPSLAMGHLPPSTSNDLSNLIFQLTLLHKVCQRRCSGCLTKHVYISRQAKCVAVTAVCVPECCVSVCLSVRPSPDPDVTWGNGRGCP